MLTNSFKLTMIFFSMLSTLSFASEEIRTLDPYSSSITLQQSDKDITIEKIEIVDAPTKMLIRVCDDISNCSPEVTESVRAVKVTFIYTSMDSHHDSTSGIIESSVTLPMDIFSKNELVKIEKITDFTFDITGSKTDELKILAQKLIGYDIKSINEESGTLDRAQAACTPVLALSPLLDDIKCPSKTIQAPVNAQILTFKRKQSI